MSDADRIRAFLTRRYVQPAKENGLREISIVAGDVHKTIGLVNRMPAVGSVLDGKKFQSENALELIETTGPRQSSTTIFRYRILNSDSQHVGQDRSPNRQTGDTANRQEEFSVAGTPGFASAVAYAALIHAKQRRKGTTIPYVSHVMSVSALVMEFGGDEDQAIAGIFHDALEYCGAWHEEVIRANWGDRVADIVLACTDGVPDAQGKKEAWRPRKERYLAHLRTVGTEVLLVSACDKLHNARTIATDLGAGHDVYARFNKDAGREGTLWYYGELERIFRERLRASHPLYREFATAIATMRAFEPE